MNRELVFELVRLRLCVKQRIRELLGWSALIKQAQRPEEDARVRATRDWGVGP